MKKLFAILLVTVLTSCGAVLEPPKSNTDYKNIIGKPIKIGNLEIAQYDFPDKMNLNDAKKACADLGEGWKLPSQDELNYLYENKVAIGGFANNRYWSSAELPTRDFYSGAWYQNFGNGNQANDDKDDTYYVRAVRTT